MELWDQRRRRPALGRATPGVQSRPSVVFADGFATAACPPRSLDWTTAPFGAPISIASGRAARGGTSLSSTAASARRIASRPTSAASTCIATCIALEWIGPAARPAAAASAPRPRGAGARRSGRSRRAREQGSSAGCRRASSLRPRSGAAATCAAASAHPFGAGLRLLAPLAVLRSGASRRSIAVQRASASSASTLAQVGVVLAAPPQLCGCFGPHCFHDADLGKVDPLRLPVACEPTEERNVVLRLLLRRPGQRPNEGAIGGRHRQDFAYCRVRVIWMRRHYLDMRNLL